MFVPKRPRDSNWAELTSVPLPSTPTDNPQDDEQVVGDPYKTLFVSRIPKEITESELRREFDIYGPLERLRLIKDKDGNSRGYAFIVYERERDMKGGLAPGQSAEPHRTDRDSPRRRTFLRQPRTRTPTVSSCSGNV